VLPAFAQSYRCLVLEFPGFGVSPDFGGHPMLDAQGAVVPFLDAVGVDKVHIVGNSMGGGVGINFAIRKPDRIGRLVTIGGIGTNIFSPSPSEGIRLLQEFVEDPTRQRLVDWLKSMVYDQAMVTEELIEERWRLATDPEALEAARRMYGKAAFAAMTAAMADAVGGDAQAGGPDAAHLGPRRPREPARHGPDPDAHHPERGAAHLPQLGALGHDRGQRRVRKHGSGVPVPRLARVAPLIPWEI
jgi:pimeloyl-ACP methyl ester carboxylesterase